MTLGVEHTASNYLFSAISSSDEERQPERAHVASAKEEIHFYYQSRQAHQKHNSHPYAVNLPKRSIHHTHFGQPYTSTAMGDFWASTYLGSTPPKCTSLQPTHPQP